MCSLFLGHFQFLWLFGFLYAMSGVGVSVRTQCEWAHTMRVGTHNAIGRAQCEWAHTMQVGMVLVVRPYVHQ